MLLVTTLLDSRSSGQDCSSACATSFAVSVSASTDPVLHWLTQQTRACEFYYICCSHDTLLTTCRFVKVLVIEIFSSVLGLFGLIIGLLLSGNANDFQ